MRLLFGLLGSMSLIHSIAGKGVYQWGRTGKGPSIQPPWLGRAFEGLAGFGFLLAAILAW